MKKNIFGQILKFIGLLFLACGVIVFFYADSIANELSIIRIPLTILSIYILFIFVIISLIFFSFGTIICLLADIEYNTRKPKIKKQITLKKDKKKETETNIPEIIDSNQPITEPIKELVKEPIEDPKEELNKELTEEVNKEFSKEPSKIVTIIAITFWLAAIVFIVIVIIKNL